MPVEIDCQISIGATGAVSSFSGAGVNAITRLSAGVYRIQLQDNYAKCFLVSASLASPVTGSAVAGGAFVTSTIYQIVTLGTTTQAQWVTAGLPSNQTAAVGMIFKAAGAGAGSGTVKALGNSGVTKVETIGSINTMLAPAPAPNLGALLHIQCLGATDASTTTLIPTDPASGSVLSLLALLSNSSVSINGS